MSQNKRDVIKGYCPKQDRYFSMTIEKVGSRWKVIDFTPLEKSVALAISPSVTQDYFETAPNLRECDFGGRKISSCSKIKCPLNSKAYSFQCIYCDKMVLDYDSDLSKAGYKEGDVIRLEQGQEIKVTMNGRSLEEIELNVGWDPNSFISMDIDSSIVLFSSQQSSASSELVYFANVNDQANSVIHHGDNLTGSPINGQSDVDEVIDIKLNKVKNCYDRIAVLINIYDANRKGQSFESVENMFIRLYDKKTHRELCGYQVSHDINQSHGLVIGLLSRSGSGWSFKAVGKAYRPENIHSFAEIIKRDFK